MIALKVDEVSFFGDGRWVLEGVGFELEEGDYLGLMGANGCGKSTLLKLIAGLLLPHKGAIEVFGNDPRSCGAALGYVPQETSFNSSFPIMAIDVVKMGFLGQKVGKQAAHDEAVKALETVGAEHLARRLIGALSGGERQRVFIARALIGGVKLLLLDEPTASIDAAGQRAISALLLKLKQKLTIVCVSHDRLLLGGADRILQIDQLADQLAPKDENG
ncbi:hypothetical protein AGMMS50229_20080 [Campylobacterota bacterium]|nr:hypothetical protein AGMMS50229_20080 [Campylobacterota bacterium]